MNEDIKKILEKLYLPNPDVADLREQLFSLTRSGSVQLSDVQMIDNHFVGERLFDVKTLVSYLRLLVGMYGYASSKYLSNIIQQVYSKDKESFIPQIIDMIIDDSGQVRFMGRLLWDDLGIYLTDFSPLSLSVENQMRFALSIVQDMINPEERLDAALSLYRSDSKGVRDLLFCCLSQYTRNYLGVVKERMNSLNDVDNEEVKLYRKFVEQLDAIYEARSKCKELLAFNTQYDVYSECRKADSAHIQSIISKADAERRPSFMDFLTKVLIARGGGFRNENGHPQRMAKISTHKYFPMMLHANSMMENAINDHKIMADWSKVTEPCEIL